MSSTSRPRLRRKNAEIHLARTMQSPMKTCRQTVRREVRDEGGNPEKGREVDRCSQARPRRRSDSGAHRRRGPAPRDSSLGRRRRAPGASGALPLVECGSVGLGGRSCPASAGLHSCDGRERGRLARRSRHQCANLARLGPGLRPSSLRWRRTAACCRRRRRPKG